jgi:hypothetical protein
VTKLVQVHSDSVSLVLVHNSQNTCITLSLKDACLFVYFTLVVLSHSPLEMVTEGLV